MSRSSELEQRMRRWVEDLQWLTYATTPRYGSPTRVVSALCAAIDAAYLLLNQGLLDRDDDDEEQPAPAAKREGLG
jgi:hypothetical protein